MGKPAHNDYRSSGTEDLGSDPKSKHTEPASQPSTKAKDAGGKDSPRVTTETKRAAWNSTPGAGAFKGNHPAKVDSFTDNKV